MIYQLLIKKIPMLSGSSNLIVRISGTNNKKPKGSIALILSMNKNDHC